MNLKTEQLNNTILKEFIFDLNNIQSLTNKEFLKILGLKTFLLKFNLEKYVIIKTIWRLKMKIYNNYKNYILPKKVQESLDKYKKSRNFSVENYVQDKINILNDYFSSYNLKTAVIAVSGGIDSSIVLSLVKKASLEKNTNIKNIIPVFLPAYSSLGVTGQNSAYNRAKELCENLELDLKIFDISKDSHSISSSIQNITNIKSDDWSEGQLIPYLRTTVLYYFTTLYTQKKENAVIIGTTNADEGQYIGYFGKASDGLVDIQLISDIHKSEVYLTGEYLSIPQSIIDVIPTGDMYDSRVDEEVFGFPYSFIEFYRFYSLMDNNEKEDLQADLIKDNQFEDFKNLLENLENMHKYNKHKYLGCSPAVHLDVLDTKVNNGWKYSNWK